jgi:hypothetical protein
VILAHDDRGSGAAVVLLGDFLGRCLPPPRQVA